MGTCKECGEFLGGSASIKDYRDHFKICPAKNPEWICTDKDAKQYCKVISKTEFEFKERGTNKVINLNDYSSEKTEEEISRYYNSLAQLKEYCNNDEEEINLVIAKCIFENNFAPPR